ncbi:MAG: hypothetical protein OXH50_13080, partial [Gemmatimonadetes bacterium]|nr:hypothetical protein [Gemmatimonadota bacterium]
LLGDSLRYIFDPRLRGAARLDRARLREQLESLKEQGVSGTWFYPRWVGGEPLRSDPPCWSEEWWDLTRFSLDEHERLGLISWFSDWTAPGEFQSRVREESLGPRPEFGGRRLVLYEKRTTIRGPEREGVQDWEKIQNSEPRGPVRIEVPVDEEILHAAAYRPAGGGIDQETRGFRTSFSIAGRFPVRPMPCAGSPPLSMPTYPATGSCTPARRPISPLPPG